MTRKELQAAFPRFTVRSDPDSDCRVCKGTGVLKGRQPCLCACLDDDGSDVRREAAACLQDVARQGLKGLRP